MTSVGCPTAGKSERIFPGSLLKVMVYMPHPWQGGFFRVACLICNTLSSMYFRGRKISVVLSVPNGYVFEPGLLDEAVTVVSVMTAQVALSDARFVSPKLQESYALPECDIPLFAPLSTSPFDERSLIDKIDCYILLNALLYEGAFVTRKPYAVYVADFIQRHVPEIYMHAAGYRASNWAADRNQRATLKNADVVFVTTPETGNDAINYAGVERSRLMHFPMFFLDPFGAGDDVYGSRSSLRGLTDVLSGEMLEDAADERYFLWVTNATPHKNHLVAADMLALYYKLGGTLRCYICGPVTDLLKPGASDHPYLVQVHRKIEKLTTKERCIRIMAYTDEAAYTCLMKNAEFLWHNVLYDNGSFSIIEAACLGTPILTSDYPQIRYIADQYRLDCTYFNPRNVEEGARRLLEMEQKSAHSAGRTPASIPPPDLIAPLNELLERMLGGEQSSRRITLGTARNQRGHHSLDPMTSVER